MAPRIKEVIRCFDRQGSYVSSISRVSSWTDLSSLATSTAVDVPSLTTLQNLLFSVAVFGAGVFGTHCFIPAHNHAYDRPHPYQTTSSGDVILNFEWNNPLMLPASVPSKVLHRTCVFLPLVVMVLVYSRSTWNCSLSSVSGLLTSIGFCEVLTHILKHYVLRRRPNFYALCGWDGSTCTAPAKKILESQLSFPSGHSSIGFCGMTFLVLILLGKLRLSEPSGRRWKPWAIWLVCLIPWSWAGYVAASRIADQWHHASDVVAGVVIGLVCAIVSYHSVFPHILSLNAGTSYTELAARKDQ